MGTMHLSGRRVLEWALSVAGLITVVVVISSLDPRARELTIGFVTSGGGSLGMPQQVDHLARVAWDLCRDHEALAGFSGVAIVLVAFMRQMR